MKASSHVYRNALRPLLAEYEANIDRELQRWFNNPNRVVGSLISFVFPMDITIKLVHDSHI